MAWQKAKRDRTWDKLRGTHHVRIRPTGFMGRTAEVNGIVWYQWTHVKPHTWRILEMLQIPIEHRFQWEESG